MITLKKTFGFSMWANVAKKVTSLNQRSPTDDQAIQVKSS